MGILPRRISASKGESVRAVDITPRMAAHVIEALKELGVESIVAPYEADHEMAFLAKTEAVHAVISEDSDMLAYGVERRQATTADTRASSAQAIMLIATVT
eukprot:7807899-Pyramimonas_sp.AAC.2